MKIAKVYFSLVIILLFFFKLSFANSVTVKKVISPVAIDGQLEESFWDLSNQISINLGASNNTANFGVLWDDNYLYIGVNVVDEKLCINGRQGWYDDGVEIYIDGNYSQGTTLDQYDRLFVKPVNSYWIQEAEERSEGVIHQWIETNDGYSMEFAIPWDNFNTSPAAGMNIGFDVVVNDDDNCDYAYNLPSQLLWSGNSNYYKNPSLWGKLLLSAETISYVSDYIAIINPNGGNFLINDKTYNIEWVSNGFNNVNIEYSTDNGNMWNTIASNISANTGSNNWNVNATASEQCKIKISDSNNSAFYDVSESVFTVSDPLSSVGPQVSDNWQVFKWPYTAYNPEDPDGNHGRRGGGCGPTALSRIIHYWEFPIVGNDELTFTDNAGFTWSANFGETTYNFDNMPDYLPEDSAEPEYTDVATLFYHAETSMHDVFLTGTDLANMSYAMNHYFNYTNAQPAVRTDYTRAEWTKLLKNELDKGRVVLVKGMSFELYCEWHEGNSVSGHWYLCDGYNEDGKFHNAISWGGYGDGYYDINNFYSYTYNIGILTGLEPELNGKELTLLSHNGGELFSNISETEITWASSNFSNIKIEYTSDNGKEWKQVTASAAAGDESYTWYLPELFSDQCKIRLSDASDINIYDKSDGTFEIANDSIALPLYFTNYDAFITKLTNLTSSTDSSAQLDQFWNELIATENFPFAINTEVAFLYRGSATKINFAGMHNNWDMNVDPGNRLGISDIWMLEKEFPADTRCEYKIVRNGSEWLTDPHNPHPLVGDYGNSELWMPDYDKHTELIVRPEIAKGTLSNNIQKNSSNLGYLCQYRVYTPAGYNSLSNLPVVYVTDGQNYLDDSMGKMVIVLDNLIADEIIEPLIAVFLDPRDPNNLSNDRRGSEYRNNINFANYVTQELIPDIDAAYKTNASADARAIMGASYGGYNAEYFSVVVPDYFHNIGMNSPYLHPNGDYNIIAELQAAPLDNMVLYMSSGTFDADAERYCNDLKDVFDQKGKEYRYTIIGDGHTWQNWSRVIGDALEYFFAKVETVSLSLTYPNGGEYFISGNTMDIKWDANLISDIKIEFSENDGSTWQEISAGTPASAKSYEWTIPDISSDQCLLKITDTSNSAMFDVSDGTFTIGETQLIGGPYTVDANTVLLLHFENNLTNSSDLSDDGVSHGSGVSYSSDTPSNLEQCLKLNNSDGSFQSYITIPHNDNLSLTGDWTIEAWINISSMGAGHTYYPCILTKPGDTDPDQPNYTILKVASSSWPHVVRCKYYSANSNSSPLVYSPADLVEIGNWYHIAFIRNTGDRSIKCLVHNADRELISEETSYYSQNEDLPAINAQDLFIGKSMNQSWTTFDGYIDEMRISNVVRDFTPVGIDEEHLKLRIESFVLHQNYPNPFNPDTRIKYQVARKGNIQLAVYNVLGQRVQTLLNRIHETGSYSVTFNATGIPSGIYYYKLTAGSLVQVRKMILIK